MLRFPKNPLRALGALPLVWLFLTMTGSLYSAANPNGFSIYRGVNISHWLSQVVEAGFPHHEIMYTELDAAFLARSGFDHVRLPVDEEQLWDEAGAPLEPQWERLQRAIRESLRQNLRVIVDLHIVRSHHFNAVNDGGRNSLFEDPAAQEHFLDLWRQLSSRLSHFDNQWVAYELLNEAVAEDPEDWNRLIERAYTVIREEEPERTLVIGSNRWQSANTFPDLRVPAEDPNLILSFHSYTPMLITHYRASWVPIRSYDGPVAYPGVPVNEEEVKADFPQEVVSAIRSMGGFDYHDRATIASEIAVAVQRAQELGLPLYCGEFGCLPTPGREIRLQYYRDLVSIFTEHDIAFANWDYRGSFRIIDPNSLEADHELISILTGQGAP